MSRVSYAVCLLFAAVLGCDGCPRGWIPSAQENKPREARGPTAEKDDGEFVQRNAAEEIKALQQQGALKKARADELIAELLAASKTETPKGPNLLDGVYGSEELTDEELLFARAAVSYAASYASAFKLDAGVTAIKVEQGQSPLGAPPTREVSMGLSSGSLFSVDLSPEMILAIREGVAPKRAYYEGGVLEREAATAFIRQDCMVDARECAIAVRANDASCENVLGQAGKFAADYREVPALAGIGCRCVRRLGPSPLLPVSWIVNRCSECVAPPDVDILPTCRPSAGKAVCTGWQRFHENRCELDMTASAHLATGGVRVSFTAPRPLEQLELRVDSVNPACTATVSARQGTNEVVVPCPGVKNPCVSLWMAGVRLVAAKGCVYRL